MLLYWNDTVTRDRLIEKTFEKSDITDLFRGNQSNLCPVHFVHLFTTGAIFYRVSETFTLLEFDENIFLGLLFLEADVKIGIFKRNRDGWTVCLNILQFKLSLK